MPLCDINLANGIIWPRQIRLRVYRALLTYLLVMSVLLVAVMERAARKVEAGTRFYFESRALQQTFAAQSPENPDLLNHARQLKEQLDKDAARIASISDALPGAVHSVLPALVLLANQPEQDMLYKLAFTQKSDKSPMLLSFDLAVPESVARTGSPSQVFVEKWQEDPLLAKHFQELKPVRSRRETLGGIPVFITQYEATDKDN
ncbi:MAG: hypothetical protein JEZ10_05160 [Verrucomicrobia bacterium]|nr:hypothetical protein [Verrucomicrobiota bacterium]